MIRRLEPKDIEVVNKYLKEFNYKIDETLNEFVNVLLYDDNGIKGVLVYSKIYCWENGRQGHASQSFWRTGSNYQPANNQSHLLRTS